MRGGVVPEYVLVPLVLFIALTLFLTGYAGASSAPVVQQQGTAERELIQLQSDWCTALLKKDTALLGSMLADDHTDVSSAGLTMTKADLLVGVSDKANTTTSCVPSNLKVRVYGNAAVVTGLRTVSGTFRGTVFKDRQILFTETFVMKTGHWQQVADRVR
jgi:hypothetical protein